MRSTLPGPAGCAVGDLFDLIGLPSSSETGRADLERWVHELKDRDPGDDRLTPVAKAATEGIRNYFVELLNERRRTPRQDLITHIVQAEIDGVPLADEDIVAASEVMGLMTILLFGSAETTSGLMSTFFKLLAENPDQRTVLQKDPSLMADAVEEAVRYATPLQLVGRTARDVTVQGVFIPKAAGRARLWGNNRDCRPIPTDVAGTPAPQLVRAPWLFGTAGARTSRSPAVALPLPVTTTVPPASALPLTPTSGKTCRRPRHASARRESRTPERTFPMTTTAEHRPHVEVVNITPPTAMVSEEFEVDVRVAAKSWPPTGRHPGYTKPVGVLPRAARGTCDRSRRADPAVLMCVIRPTTTAIGWASCASRQPRRPEYIHDRLQVGDTRVRGPRNNFPLAHAAVPVHRRRHRDTPIRP
jgi:hypothetical protein